MNQIPRKYIVDENDRRVAVQLDIETFEIIEGLLENYGLVQLMREVEKEKALSISEAKQYYDTLKKSE